MSKYIFKKLPDKTDWPSSEPDLTEIKVTTEHTALSDILETFGGFLAACGFVVPAGSELQFVNDKEEGEE